MKTTFFKVDRDIQNNWLWADKPFSRGQAWIDLLLLATHKDHRGFFAGKVVTRKRGEVHVSVAFLSERWGWSRNKVYRFLNLLKTEQMVTYNGTADGTVITIEKYAFYQGEYTAGGTTSEQPRNNLGTTSEQPRNINNKGYKGEKRTIMDNNGLIDERIQERVRKIREKGKQINEEWKAIKPELWRVEK